MGYYLNLIKKSYQKFIKDINTEHPTLKKENQVEKEKIISEPNNDDWLKFNNIYSPVAGPAMIAVHRECNFPAAFVVWMLELNKENQKTITPVIVPTKEKGETFLVSDLSIESQQTLYGFVMNEPYVSLGYYQ